jgi:hypothetical protein
MPFVNDRVMDEGLSALTAEANRLDICSQEPTSYAEATATYTLANAPPTVGSPSDRSPDGRKVTISPIPASPITSNGTASHWAITDTGNSRLLATGSLAAPIAITTDGTFSLTAFDIGIPDA